MRLGVAAVVIVGAAVFAACRTTPAHDAKPPPAAIVTSNVERKDYAGSAACAPCHGEIYERWQKTPMHDMTRAIETASVHAPFDGSKFAFKDDVATMLTVQGRRYLRLDTKEKGASVFRVTKVIGG